MRTRDKRAVLATGVAAALALALSTGGDTFAAWSDRVVVSTGAKAGTWGPEIPAECGDVGQYTELVEGTPGDDTIDAGNGKQIVLAGDGDDTVLGGNGKDCLVGGDGNDSLDGGNGKDVLLGAAGDDLLLGANGPDTVLGGSGNDACDLRPGPSVAECETYIGPSVPSGKPERPGREKQGSAAETEAGPEGSETSSGTEPHGGSKSGAPTTTQPSPGSVAPSQPSQPVQPVQPPQPSQPPAPADKPSNPSSAASEEPGGDANTETTP